MTHPTHASFAWIERFDRVTRSAHWALAVLVGVLVGTGALLYVDDWAAAVGRRRLIRDVHVIVGLALPVAAAVAAVGPWGRRLRRDVRLLDRWPRGELGRLLTRSGPGAGAFGKFLPVQRLFAAFAAGALVVQVLTGGALHWFRLVPLAWRTGATFVHDATGAALVVGITAHVALAVAHPTALRAMVTGWVPASWARRRHPGWFESLREQAELRDRADAGTSSAD